jgi:two-component sensor histidine kinase
MTGGVVSKAISSERRSSEEQLLVGELTHRMNNEFSTAIAVVSLAAARSPNGKVKSALAAVEARLNSYVQVNHYLQIPSQDTVIDASAHLRRLCQSIGRSRLDCRGIELQFAGRPLRMNSERCWRLGMIISELITNAARHAFGDGGGKIQVELSQCGPFVNCRVADDGTAPEKMRPGRGLAIVERLIASLDGTINQHFGPGGAVSDMILPVGSCAQHTGPSALFPPKSRDTVLRVGPLELDLIERAAKRWDRAIDLLPREFHLLEYMMRRKEQVLTRALLLKDVWNYRFVPETNLVNVHMGRLRRKVDGPHELPMIHNVRGVGFILRAPT